jgi:hypothetical protein
VFSKKYPNNKSERTRIGLTCPNKSQIAHQPV